MGNERRETQRDFVLFLNTWEWLQNYWEWHWKHSVKKNPPSAHPNCNWLHHRRRQGCFPSLSMGWLMFPRPESWEEAAALPSLASAPPHALTSVPTQQHSSVCPSCCSLLILPPSPVDIDIPAADSQQAAGQRKIGGRGVWAAEALKGWTCTALICKGCAGWKPRAKILSDVKGFSIFTHFPELPTLSQQSGKL